MEKSNKVSNSIIIAAIAFLVGVVASSFFGRFSESDSPETEQINGLYFVDSVAIMDADNDDVYICTGPTAKKYHCIPDCRWLENCSGEIREVSLTYARNQGKTACRGCY